MNEADEKLIRNESAKLAATLLNSIAAASVAVGILAPSVAVATGTLPPIVAAILAAGWLPVALLLHWVAQRILRRLRA